jgi:hypothetical protein
VTATGLRRLSRKLRLPIDSPNPAAAPARRCVRLGVSQSQASVRLREAPAVPDQPDCGWVDDWLHRSHLDFWASHRYPTPQRGQKQMPIDGCLTTASDDAAGPGPG